MAKEIEPVEATQITPYETVTPNQLLSIAVQTNADPVLLDKLMDLQLKWEANEAKKSYIVAMANFRSKCPVIAKTRSVDFTSAKGRTQYNHAGLSEAIEQIKGLMSESGLSHSWRTTQVEQCVTVRCIVTHIGGHSEETSLTAHPDNTGNKNSIQAIASTVSYLERYTLFAMLGLASQEMDDDANGAGKEKEKEKPRPGADVTAIVEQTFFDYTTENSDLLPENYEWDQAMFKEELRAVFMKLSQVKRTDFEWTKETTAELAKKIKPDKIIKELQAV